MSKQKTLFQIPYWHSKTKNFDKKKKEIVKMLEDYPEHRTDTQNFSSNRYDTNKQDMMSKFVNIIKEEIREISQEIKSNLAVTDVWSASYETGDYHIPHIHNSTGISAILYLDLPKDGPCTTYIQPWSDIFSDTTIHVPLSISEGDIVFVPSSVVHFTEPNKSDSVKRIVSWDMKPIGSGPLGEYS